MATPADQVQMAEAELQAQLEREAQAVLADTRGQAGGAAIPEGAGLVDPRLVVTGPQPPSLVRRAGERVPGALVASAPVIGLTAGGLAGAALGAPLGGVGAPATAATGAGLGAASGRLAQRPLAQLLGVEPPPAPTAPELTAEVAGGFFGELGGRALAVLGRPFVPTIRPDVREVQAAARATGVPLKLTDIAGGRGPAQAESMVRQSTGGPRIAAAEVEQARALSSAADEFLTSLGPSEARSAVGTGLKATEAIRRTVDRTRTVENTLFESVTTLAQGGDAPVSVALGSVKGKAAEILREQMDRLPAARDARLVSLLRQVLKARAAVPFRQARAWQKGFGEAIERGELISELPGGQAKALFAAVSDDMERAVERSGRRDLLPAFQRARAFATNRRELFVDSPIAKVLTTDPEDVIRQIDAAGGPTAVQRLRTAVLGRLPPSRTPDPADVEAWNLVRRHVLEGVFAPTAEGGALTAMRGLPQEVISGATLGRKLGRIGNETLAELLTPVERQALRNLEVVADAIQQGQRVGAVSFTSTTPQGLALQGLLGGGVGGITGAALGGVEGAAVGAFVTMLTVPPVMARALTNPKVAAFLASPLYANIARGGRQAITGVTRLAGLLVAEGLVPPPTREGRRGTPGPARPPAPGR